MKPHVKTAPPPPAAADPLLKLLRDDPYAIDNAQRAATQAYNEASRQPAAPTFKLETEWQGFRDRTNNAPRTDGRPNSAADQAHKIARLKIAQECRAHFAAEVARLKSRTPQQCRDESARDEMARHHAPIQRPAPTPTRPRMTPAEFLAQLRGRGISISIGSDGGLLACPGSLLTDADRGVLTDYKAQIATLLADTVQVA